MHKRKTSAFITFSILFLSMCPVADQASGAAVEGMTASIPLDARFKPRLGTYNYKVAFNKLDVINASIDIHFEGDFYMTQVKAETTGTIDRIFRMRYKGQSITDTDPLNPVETKTEQKVRSKEKFMTMSFLENGLVRTTEKKLKNGDTISSDTKNYQAGRYIFDPFSLCYLIRALDWQAGRSQAFTVYTGKKEYELSFRCTGETTIDFSGEKRAVWIIVPDIKEFDDGKHLVEVKKKPSNMRIYLSADENKDILKMEASHPLGYFQIIMTGFQPTDHIRVASSCVPEKGSRIKILPLPAYLFSNMPLGFERRSYPDQLLVSSLFT